MSAVPRKQQRSPIPKPGGDSAPPSIRATSSLEGGPLCPPIGKQQRRAPEIRLVSAYYFGRISSASPRLRTNHGSYLITSNDLRHFCIFSLKQNHAYAHKFLLRQIAP